MEKDKAKLDELYGKLGDGATVVYEGVPIRVIGARFAHGGLAIGMLPELTRGVFGAVLLMQELRQVSAVARAAAEEEAERDGEAEDAAFELSVDTGALAEALGRVPLDQLRELGAALTACVGLLNLHCDIDVTDDAVPLDLGLLLLAAFLEQSKLGKVVAAARRVMAGAAAFEGVATEGAPEAEGGVGGGSGTSGPSGGSGGG